MARYRALLATNRGTPRKYEIANAADGAEATIYLYDLIDPYWGVGAAQFVKDLAAVTAPVVNLRINSPGGDVFDGRAIATAIREHGSKVVAHVDGLAASAASFIALAADEVVMAPGAMMMIHRASSLAWGNAEDMLHLADVLEKIDDSLVAEYVRETGQEEAQVREWLNAETWFTADEAVQYGFADRLSEEAVAVDNAWDLTVFARGPAAAPVASDSKDADTEHADRVRRLRLLELDA